VSKRKHNPTPIIPDEDLRNTKHIDATALQKDLLHLLKDENIKITFEAEKSDKTTDIETNEDDRAPHSTEELYYYHPDHLGTATFLTDYIGNPYQIEDSSNTAKKLLLSEIIFLKFAVRRNRRRRFIEHL